MLTIYEFVQLFTDNTRIEIYSLDDEKTIFRGWSNEIPEDVENLYICSIDPICYDVNAIVVNV